MISIPIPRKTVLALLGACACAGCERSSPNAEPVVRDSSGIVIVENAHPAWQDGRGWRLSEVPVLSIGKAEGRPEEELSRVTDALRLPDGRIVIANDGSKELRYFSADGRFLGAAGRDGEGPGEFRAIARLWLAGGDTVVAYDPLLHRLTSFKGAGTLAGSVPVAPLPGGGPLPPEVVGRFADGSLVARALLPLPLDAPAGMKRDPVDYFRIPAGDAAPAPMGSFPGDESFVIHEGSGVSANQPMFGRRTQVAVGGERFYIAPGDAYRIDEHGANGRLVRSIRVRQPAVRVTTADVERFRHDYLEAVAPEERPRLERIFARVPVPSTFPAHGRILVDAEGNLWVAAYRRPGEERQTWNVFDPRGRWLGPVVVPGRFRITTAGAGMVMGVARDEQDVEQVQVYSLVR